MSDEQTRLLQEILDAIKVQTASVNEQTAFAKQQRDEFMALQQAVFDRQKKTVRVVLVFMAALVAFLAYTVAR